MIHKSHGSGILQIDAISMKKNLSSQIVIASISDKPFLFSHLCKHHLTNFSKWVNNFFLLRGYLINTLICNLYTLNNKICDWHGLYYKNIKSVIDDHKWCSKLWHHSLMILVLLIMLLESSILLLNNSIVHSPLMMIIMTIIIFL